jgi:hypothetical protein
MVLFEVKAPVRAAARRKPRLPKLPRKKRPTTRIRKNRVSKPEKK